jgi:signal transduction histidine kinase/CheY-like chemotaxis protein
VAIAGERARDSAPGPTSLELGDVRSLLGAVVANAADALMVKSADGIYLFANEAAARMMKVSSVDVLLGRRDSDVLPPEVARRARSSDLSTMEQGVPITVEGAVDGRPYQWHKNPWRDAQGHIIGIVARAHEISADESAASRFLESQELLDLIQNAGQIGLFEWKVQEQIVWLSPAFLTLYGIKNFDGCFESWLNCIYREDRLRITNSIENSFDARSRSAHMEFRIANSDNIGVKWVEARNLIFYDADHRAVRVVGVTVDATDRKASALRLLAMTETLEDRVKERTRELVAENEARLKAEALLRQSQKMEAVGQLTGGVAHDFNNLLTIVLGGLEMIARQLPTLDPTPAAARIARGKELAADGARRAATLTQRLLAFSRQQPLAQISLDANKLVSEISELLRRTLGEGVMLETVLAGGLWTVNADANQLENAIVNLALNARDALPAGGRVTIETANCYLDEAYVAAIAEPVKAGQYVQIAIADTGMGMSQATLERAVEPFFTTKDVGKGTGLGLSQVYGFVRQSDGHLRIYSEVDQGTTVKIYLPRYYGVDDEVEAPTRSSSDTLRAIGTETILVVEDDDVLRTYGLEVLSELGYRVLEASTGAAALDALARAPHVDLLFTDIVMPGGINGRQLADEAMRRRPGLKVLFTTGYTRNAIVHHGRLDPDVRLIGKPFTFDELAAKVRAILDERQG